MILLGEGFLLKQKNKQEKLLNKAYAKILRCFMKKKEENKNSQILRVSNESSILLSISIRGNHYIYQSSVSVLINYFAGDI